MHTLEDDMICKCGEQLNEPFIKIKGIKCKCGALYFYNYRTEKFEQFMHYGEPHVNFIKFRINEKGF